MNKPKFLKPNLEYDNQTNTIDRLNELENQQELVKFNVNGDSSIQVQREQLPIFKYKHQILYALESNRVVIVVGETGSGKSTQLPQYLLENGWTNSNKMICVTEPRRIAAINLAKRICDEKSFILGEEVGYSIRFEDCFKPGQTRIKMVTEGLLIREFMQNPFLNKYSVVILDEVHERNTNIDILIGLFKKIMNKRDDLKLIICSATVDAEQIKMYFDEANLKSKNKSESTALSTVAISIEGRCFPIDIYYLSEPCDNYVKACVITAFSIHMSQDDGDILMFLTGQDEVDEAVSMLIDKASDLKSFKQAKILKKLWVLPLYGTLSINEQLKVFERTPRNTRKIIVSTNIAETSLTINGIVYVIDCGFMKLKAYDPRLGCESLITVAISKSSANQRAGRAGRYRSGKTYRIYPETEYNKFKEYTPPEIQRCDLAAPIIQLKALGIDNIFRFDFLSAPPSNNLINTLELLHALGSLDNNAKLTTPLGFEMAEFPLHPTHAKALLAADDFGCTDEMLTIISMLQVQNVFTTPSNRKLQADKAKLKFTCIEGDHITFLNVYKSFYDKYIKNNKKFQPIVHWCSLNFLNHKALLRAMQIRDQLRNLLKKFKRNVELTCSDHVEPILKCLCVAFFANAAKSTYSGDYKHLKSDVLLKVHPTSVINLCLSNLDEPPPKCIIYNDIVQSKTTYLIRDISVIKSEWLYDLVPNYYEFGTDRQIREISDKRLKLN